MALLIVIDWFNNANYARRSPVMWILLLAAFVLTIWECRSRRYGFLLTLWWSLVSLLTHVIGYLILRLRGRSARRT